MTKKTKRGWEKWGVRQGRGTHTHAHRHSPLYLYRLTAEEEMQKTPLKSGEYSSQPGCYKLEPVSITMYINSHTSF